MMVVGTSARAKAKRRIRARRRQWRPAGEARARFDGRQVPDDNFHTAPPLGRAVARGRHESCFLVVNHPRHSFVESIVSTSRRTFLKLSAAAGGAVGLGALPRVGFAS